MQSVLHVFLDDIFRFWAMAARVIHRHYKALSNRNGFISPYICLRPDEQDLFRCHFVLHNFETESPHYGAVYHGYLRLPQEFPHKPPAILMVTPNGRFETGKELCMSASSLHLEHWNPMWGLENLVVGFLSFFQEDVPSAGSLKTPPHKTKYLARNSFHFNKANKKFCNIFTEFADDEKFNPNVGFMLLDSSSAGPQTPDRLHVNWTIVWIIFIILAVVAKLFLIYPKNTYT
eukprot:Selendium_serpulae@DN4305_c0_g1_i4.p1